MLKADEIARLLQKSMKAKKDENPFLITPAPDLKKLKSSGSASIDLRLGRWFITLRAARLPSMEVMRTEDKAQPVRKLAKSHYVSFGQEYYLHPHHFSLATTLEWICLPTNLSGYVIGKSSWGRRGLIIATATGVHPGFKGCLTLELCNVGEIPIALLPGMEIGQFFLHRAGKGSKSSDRTQFYGMRKPILGQIELDDFARKLADVKYACQE